MSDLLSAALAFDRAGCSVIPTATDGSKKPYGKWKQYQSSPAPAAQLNYWFGGRRHDGFGVICGSVSGGLELFEFEGRAVQEGLLVQFAEALKLHGFGDLWDKVIGGYLEKSPSGGLHILYRVDTDTPLGNLELAKRPSTAEEFTAWKEAEQLKINQVRDGEDRARQQAAHDKITRPEQHPQVLIETRGEGGFSIVAPSGGRTHPSGRPWELLKGGPTTIATITTEERDVLHTAARVLDAMPVTTPIVSAASSPSSGGSTPYNWDRHRDILPGTDFNLRGPDWADILHGYFSAVGPMDGGRSWRRAGKDRDISATTGTRGDGDNLWVFSTSTIFEANRPYDKFAAYTLINFGSTTTPSFQKASAELHRQGYGTKRPTSPSARSTGAQTPAQSPEPVADLLAAQLETVLAAIRNYKDEHGDLSLTERPHKTYGTEYRFRCPAHTNEALSTSSAAAGRTRTKVTLYCNHSRNGQSAILAALGVPDALGQVPTAQIPGVDEDDPRPRLDVTDEVTAIEGTVQMICERTIPDTYVRAGTLVVVSEARGKVAVNDVGEDRLRALLTEHAVTYRDTPRGKARALPSVTTCRAILARENWPGVPELAGVVSTPVLRPDGTVLQDPGYDPVTKLYLHRRVQVPTVPDRPSAEQVSAACDLLLNRMLVDFPWVTAADKANYLAAIFTQILRPYVRGLSPLIDITAHERGSGKTLLADVIRHVFGADMRAWPEHDAEMRKSITAALRETQPAVIFDNVPARAVVEYPSLAMVLTNPEWTDRVLGRTKQISLPNDRLWIVTGTNVRVGGDLAQRTLLVRIDPNMPRPDLRTDFVIPDLESWVQEHRGEVLHALLTLARAWIAAGAPRAEFAMRGFTRWARALGGLLAFHGVKGFLDNRQEIEPYDEDSEVWSAFLAAWSARYGDQPVSAKELLNDVGTWPAENEWSTVFPRVGDGDGGVPSVKLLNRMLKERTGRWYGPLTVRGRQDSHSKTWVWFVAEKGSQGGAEGGSSETPSTPSGQGGAGEVEADEAANSDRSEGISGANSADVADVADDPGPNVLAHTPPPPSAVGGGRGSHIGRSLEPPQRPQRPQDQFGGGPPSHPSQPSIEDIDDGSTDDAPDPLDVEPIEETG